jgi:hypothetical protein
MRNRVPWNVNRLGGGPEVVVGPAAARLFEHPPVNVTRDSRPVVERRRMLDPEEGGGQGITRVPVEAHGQLTRALDIRRGHEHIDVGHGPQTRIAVEARDQGQSLEDDGIDAGLLEGSQQGKNAVVEALVLAPGEEVSLLQGIDLLGAGAEVDEVPVHERKQ